MIKQVIRRINIIGINYYRISPVFMRDYKRPLHVEIIGYGGKTHLLKKLAVNFNLKRKHILTHKHISNSRLESHRLLFTKLFSVIIFQHEDYLQKISRIINKIYQFYTIENNGLVFYDEGLVKEIIPYIVEIDPIIPKEVKSFLNTFCFIVVVSDLELTIKRIIFRDNIVKSSRIEEIESYTILYAEIIKDFINILKKNDLLYYVYQNDGNPDNYNRLIEFIKTNINEES